MTQPRGVNGAAHPPPWLAALSGGSCGILLPAGGGACITQLSDIRIQAASSLVFVHATSQKCLMCCSCPADGQQVHRGGRVLRPARQLQGDVQAGSPLCLVDPLSMLWSECCWRACAYRLQVLPRGLCIYLRQVKSMSVGPPVVQEAPALVASFPQLLSQALDPCTAQQHKTRQPAPTVVLQEVPVLVASFAQSLSEALDPQGVCGLLGVCHGGKGLAQVSTMQAW